MALRVPAIGLAVEAGLLVGMTFPPAPDAPFPFLYVYFGVVLPAGIPLGQSGLALKGARGLFGLNVEPDREPDQNPYYDWYKRGPIEGAHPTTKWRDRDLVDRLRRRRHDHDGRRQARRRPRAARRWSSQGPS